MQSELYSWYHVINHYKLIDDNRDIRDYICYDIIVDEFFSSRQCYNQECVLTMQPGVCTNQECVPTMSVY